MTTPQPEKQQPSLEPSDAPATAGATNTGGAAATLGASAAPPELSKQALEAWLQSSYLDNNDGMCGVTLSLRDYINYLRHETPATADFTSEMLDWALETVKSPDDVVIASTAISETLYSIGVGLIKDEASGIVQQQYADQYRALEGKRYVFLLANNGFEKPKRDKNHNLRTGSEKGAHWSFVFVDTQLGTASYIDGTVRIIVGINKKGQTVHRILNNEINGRIAARVLHGYDTVMKRPRGQLEAKTLKWVPQQSTNDPFDAGVCGPYIWKTIVQILEKQSGVLDSRGALEIIFAQTRQNQHVFNLREARKEIQRRIQKKREEKEKASDNLYPYNLSPSRIAALLTPEFLRQALSGNVLKAFLDIQERPATSEPPMYNLEEQKIIWAIHEAEKGRDSRTKKIPSNDDATDRNIFWRIFFPPWTKTKAIPFIRSHMEDLYQGLIEAGNEEAKKRYDFAKKYGSLNTDCSMDEFVTMLWPSDSQLEADYNRSNGLDIDQPDPASLVSGTNGTSKSPASTGEGKRANAPMAGGTEGSAAKMPGGHEFPLFITLSDDEVETWTRNLGTSVNKTIQGWNLESKEDRTRGLLHRLFVGEFADLIHERGTLDGISKKAMLLNDWLAHDAHCSQRNFSKTSAAVRQLEELYGTPKTLPLPFLRDNPSCWPPRDQWRAYVPKRKLDDEGSGKPIKKIKTGPAPPDIVEKPANVDVNQLDIVSTSPLIKKKKVKKPAPPKKRAGE